MPYHKPLDPGSVNAWKANLSSAMKRLAAARTCKACQRGNAMSAWMRVDAERFRARTCRYCGHEESKNY